MMEAILLGAGLSKRMGRQKLLLPFGGRTVKPIHAKGGESFVDP